jgi:hypothetical protein
VTTKLKWSSLKADLKAKVREAITTVVMVARVLLKRRRMTLTVTLKNMALMRMTLSR